VKAVLNSQVSSQNWGIVARFEVAVETPEGKAKKQSGPAMACDWNNISVMAS
jgi:hypothetical protein